MILGEAEKILAPSTESVGQMEATGVPHVGTAGFTAQFRIQVFLEWCMEST